MSSRRDIECCERDRGARGLGVELADCSDLLENSPAPGQVHDPTAADALLPQMAADLLIADKA
jgi:hypothetical protein